MTVAASALAKKNIFGHLSLRVATRRQSFGLANTISIRVAPFVSAFVVLHGCLALLSTRDAGAYPLVFQRISEPVRVRAAIPEQPVHIRYAARQRSRADAIADLTGGDEKADRPPLAVTDGMAVWRSCPPLGLDRSGGRGEVCLRIGRIDRHGLSLAMFGDSADRRPGEDALVAPTVPPAVECLARPVGLGRVSPS